MITSNLPLTTIGWVAIAIGIVGLLALLAIILFFTIGQPSAQLMIISFV